MNNVLKDKYWYSRKTRKEQKVGVKKGSRPIVQSFSVWCLFFLACLVQDSERGVSGPFRVADL